MSPSIAALTEKLRGYLDSSQIGHVVRAYNYAERAHVGQTRHTGEPYVTHPLAVASILADMHMDHQSLMAAMLHDVIEDTDISKSTIHEQFGETVAELVDGVSKLTHIKFEDYTVAQAENFQKMAMAMARDIRVILVKLADRLHNMRTLNALPPHKRRRIARETFDIYSPIAHRLGMQDIKVEFENLGFAAIYPMRADLLKKAVHKARKNRSEIVGQIVRQIEGRLAKESLNSRVVGREKHLYSIYSKMRRRHKSFSEIMDVFAVRLIVDTVDACYRALGIMHSLFKPIPGRFKDYIAIPKANGYQSLHTTLFGPHGIPVEVQIRTTQMDDMANNGIAAHWLYKSSEEALIGSHNRTRSWLQNLLNLKQTAGNPVEFIESVKVDLFPDEVYVFTPKGEIMELPRNATPVDFAYAVHTDVGNSCVACRIDRKFASLSQILQSGETVDVITAPRARPSATWLNYVVSSKARSNIRHYLKNQREAESITLGKRLLDKVLDNLGSSLEQVPEERLEAMLANTECTKLDELLANIGLGNKIACIIARGLVEDRPDTRNDADPALEMPLVIRGAENMVLTFARCCYPIPGDPVVGHISTGRGLVIHTENCHNINDIRHNPNKILKVEWAPGIQHEFAVDLVAEVAQKRGMIASMAAMITIENANIDRIDITERNSKLTRVQVLIGVRDHPHLVRIIRRLRNTPGVHSVKRSRDR